MYFKDEDTGVTTWIAFLRAINLGATRKFAKAAIVGAVTAAGGTDVATYINTGNVRLDHEIDDRAQIELALEKAFEEAAGFAVPTICVTPAELRDIAAYADGLAHPQRHYVSLLKEEPAPELVAALEARSNEKGSVHVHGRAVHLLLGENYHQAELTNAAVERALGVATNRNLNVIRTLAQTWG